MRNLEGGAGRVNGGCGIEAPFRGRVLLIANVCTAHAKLFQDVECLGYQAQKMTDRAGKRPQAVRGVTASAPRCSVLPQRPGRAAASMTTARPIIRLMPTRRRIWPNAAAPSAHCSASTARRSSGSCNDWIRKNSATMTTYRPIMICT
ncbi:hypothetical protein ALQ60_101162 [Pseudomonas syringae pv. papulans]|nr:hypothetical protein ALO65_101234 [Pseudomonas syringae pv. papulans]RMN37487.1 hypothetical protein ALQ60_101162 [Pseudomonas syringae pv. papulans]RMN70156.1 hypothetical protein ALQ56_101643 [Pseudomonas syringae pv. papulans]RMV50372.1 hypothetical protein ALP11_101412 [Pseudomonas syringae pv. papulans]